MSERTNIHIYWIVSHKDTEKYESQIEYNGEKIDIFPIYESKEILSNYITSVFTHNFPKVDFYLNYYSQNVSNLRIITQKKLIKVKDNKNDHYFLYDFLPLINFSQEMQFELYLEMLENKFNFNIENLHHMKEILLLDTKSFIQENKKYYDLLFFTSVLMESFKSKKIIPKIIVIFKSLLKPNQIKITSITQKRFTIIQNTIDSMLKNQGEIIPYFEQNKNQ